MRSEMMAGEIHVCLELPAVVLSQRVVEDFSSELRTEQIFEQLKQRHAREERKFLDKDQVDLDERRDVEIRTGSSNINAMCTQEGETRAIRDRIV